MKTLHERMGIEVKSNGLTLIDAHHHLWDLSKNHYPWLATYEPGTFVGDYRSLMRNYLPEDYAADSAGHRVLATVHCEADHDYSNEVAETRWVHEQAARAGFPNAVVAHIWFHRDDGEEILNQHLHFPLVRGIRSKPVTAKRPELAHTVRGASCSMQDEKWLKGFGLLEKYGLSWDLRVPYWHLEEAAEVARIYPNVPIVLNHMGFPWDRSPQGLDAWRQGMRALAACPNVHVKVSELGVQDRPWTIEGNRGVVLETVEMFGIERCMFASNFPVAGLQLSYRELVNNMSEIFSGFSPQQREAFFWRNAKAFYRIDLPED